MVWSRRDTHQSMQIAFFVLFVLGCIFAVVKSLDGVLYGGVTTQVTAKVVNKDVILTQGGESTQCWVGIETENGQMISFKCTQGDFVLIATGIEYHISIKNGWLQSISRVK